MLLPCWCLKGVCAFMCNSHVVNEYFMHIHTNMCMCAGKFCLFKLKKVLI